MERLQTGQDRSSTSKVIRLNTVPAGQRYAMVMPSYFSRLSMLNAKKPSPHHHDMQGKTILAFRRIVLIFIDCLHLLALHEPGNELRIVPELTVPGGSIDYCLVSVRSGKVIDFAGIELQTLDTTGTVWPERQRFLQSHGIPVRASDADSDKKFGMNWKMTAKTILMQLHHKVQTFEHLSKHLVLVTQDCLIEYMQRGFSFEHLHAARLGDPMHFYAYQLVAESSGYKIQLSERWSTDTNSIAQCLGLQTSSKVELEMILKQIEAKLPQSMVLSVGQVGTL